jgi:uncharacterized protein YmfQ (DUF2313 family)
MTRTEAIAHPTLDEVLRIAKQMTAQGNEAAAKTLIESWFREHGKDGTQSKSSRAGRERALSEAENAIGGYPAPTFNDEVGIANDIVSHVADALSSTRERV